MLYLDEIGNACRRRKNGRPPKLVINKNIFESLCRLQCTAAEIASAFNVSQNTLTDWCKRVYGQTFIEVYTVKSQGGKISVRRKQFKLANKSASMAIFLGKQMLGQKEEPVININAAISFDGEVDIPE